MQYWFRFSSNCASLQILAFLCSKIFWCAIWNKLCCTFNQKKKTSNPRTAVITFFEIFLMKIKVYIQFILKAISRLSLLFLRRKKTSFEKVSTGLLINYPVQPTGVLLISYYQLTWEKDFCGNFLTVRLLPWYSVNVWSV